MDALGYHFTVFWVFRHARFYAMASASRLQNNTPGFGVDLQWGLGSGRTPRLLGQRFKGICAQSPYHMRSSGSFELEGSGFRFSGGSFPFKRQLYGLPCLFVGER